MGRGWRRKCGGKAVSLTAVDHPQSQNREKDEEREALHYFRELRFVPFGDNRKPYQSQYVAIEWRDHFIQEVAPKMSHAPISRALFKRDQPDQLDPKRVGLALDSDATRGIIAETFAASSVNKSDDSDYDVASAIAGWFAALLGGNTVGLAREHWERAVCRTGVLAAAARLDPARDRAAVAAFLRKHTAVGDEQTWTAAHYNEGFEKIPELRELTNTPFMVQIVTKILPRLSSAGRSASELKSGFVILLGEGIAEVAWAALREPRDDVAKALGKRGEAASPSVLANLHQLQLALDAPKDDQARVQWLGLLRQLSREMAVTVEAAVNKNPAEWDKPGALPEGCELDVSDAKAPNGLGSQSVARVVAQDMVDAVFRQVRMAPWRSKLTAVIERALLRTLRRQPTRRVHIYNQFVAQWLDREIGKALSQRGLGVPPQQLRLEVRDCAARARANSTTTPPNLTSYSLPHHTGNRVLQTAVCLHGPSQSNQAAPAIGVDSVCLRREVEPGRVLQ